MNDTKNLIMHYHIDNEGNPTTIQIREENNQISPHNYLVQLLEIPSKSHRLVVVDDLNNEMYEVEYLEDVNESSYYVDYQNGLVHFHPSKAGKTYIFSYYGEGIQLIGASRIYDESTYTGNFIIKTIQEIIDKGRQCIEALSTIGNAVDVLNRLEQDITTGNILHTNLLSDISIGQPLQTQLHQDIEDGMEFKDQLNADVAEGKTLQPILQKTVDDANVINTTLIETVDNVQDSINLITSTQNPDFNILATDWVTNTDSTVTSAYMYEKNHGLQTEKLQVACKDMDTKISIFPNYKVVNGNILRFFTDSKFNENVVLSAGYHIGGSAIDDEVIQARGSDLTLDERLDGIDLYLNDISINVKNFGAKANGITDDTQAIVNCFDYCITNKKKMFFPNGNYIFNGTLNKSNNILTDVNKDIPIFIEGESKNGVIINRSDGLTINIIDFGESNFVYIKNISSENAKIKLYPTFTDVMDFAFKCRNRNLFAENILINSTELGGTSWLTHLTTPKPQSFSRDFKDSRYSTYPMEITNNSGYNALNINNINLNDNNTIANPADNSAIGITDVSNGVAGAFYIDMYGERRFMKFARRGSAITSGIDGSGIVYDISPDGHIAIGCSYLNNDTNANGVATAKLRDASPSIALYDFANSNMLTKFISSSTNFIIYHNGNGIFRANKDGHITLMGLGFDMKMDIINPDNTKGINLIRDNQFNKIYVDSTGLIRVATKPVGQTVEDREGKILQVNYTGATSQRPTGLRNFGSDIGFQYYDQTIKKPIYWSGVDWRDSMSVIV